ncbi:MAG: PstS family phosphate ABC transporter substrate-binding protein [Anaerolineales bacterium]
MNRKIQTVLALHVVASVLLAACATPAATQAPGGQATTDPYSPLSVSGDIVTAGSSTVFPLTERMAERFNEEGFEGHGTITVDSIGSGAGFERFCEAGESDLSNASRGIEEDEVALCEAIGRTPIEFRVGTDALAIVVSQENDFLTGISMEQLVLIFSTAVTWSDVDPLWPAEPIRRFSPGTDSGTYDYFVEAVLDDDPSLIQNSVNTQYSEDDNVLVQGVLGSPYAIGYFGYAYYVENRGTLKILDIDGVTPTEVTAEDGSYPLARPLFIYSDAGIMAEKAQVAAFIHFYLSFGNEEIIDVGYFPPSEAATQNAWDNFWAAVGQ